MLDTARRAIGKLFSHDATPASRKRSVTLDELSPENIPEGALAAFFELEHNRYPETDRRLRDSIDLRAGKKRPAMHPNWDLDDRENLRADGPEKYEYPRQVTRRLGAKKAKLKRPAAGIEPKSQRDSTRIEQWGNGYLDEQYPDIEVVDLLGNEGETLVVQIPAPQHWECIPTLYDEWEQEGKHASQDAYDALPEKRKREYESATSGEAPTYKRMRKRYRLNKDGEPDDGSDEHETDLQKSAKYFRDEMHDAFARNIPIEMRGPISRLDFVPINPVFKGKATECEGVIIRTLFRPARLKRLYRFEGCDDQLLEPTTSYDGIDGEFWLYELWAYDELHRPYVAYQVGTRASEWKDTGTTAVVKLWEEYPGITELPIAFEYGQHNAGSNADLRTLTLTTSRQQNWLQRDGVLTAMAINANESGYSSWVQEMTEDGVKAMRALGGDTETEFVAQPNVVHRVFGKISEIKSSGVSPTVELLLNAIEALAEKGTAGEGAFGGEGPTSGLDRQLQGRDTEVSYGDIIEGNRRIKEKCGRHGLMIGSAMGRKCDRPVELYVMGSATLPSSRGEATTRTRISLPPDLCGDNWDVIAEMPSVLGENLANQSFYLTVLEKGGMLMREFREKIGDDHPEQFVAEKILEDYFLKNPAGQFDALLGMAEYVRDTRLQKLLQLTSQGKMTGAEGGMPTVAMDDLLGTGGTPGMADAPGQAVVGTGSAPNPGMQALAAGNGAVMSADAAASGGPMAAPAGVGMMRA